MDTLWHILSAIASMSVPFIAWLGKSYLDLHNRLVKTETLLEERSRILKEVKSQQDVDSHRITQSDSTLTAVQVSLQEFRSSIGQRLAEVNARLDNFSDKLEMLPTIVAQLESISKMAERIVPRELYDDRISNLNTRIASIEERLTEEHR